VVKKLKYFLGAIPWQRVVEHGCEVQQHHCCSEDARACNPRCAAIPNCGKDENRVAANAAAKPTAWLTLFAISSPGDGERSREAGALAIAFITMKR